MPTTKTNTIRVLLVDDHEVVRVGLRSVLSQNHGIVVVGESATTAEAVGAREREGGADHRGGCGGRPAGVAGVREAFGEHLRQPASEGVQC